MSVVVRFDCHPEQALFAQRGIWASRAMRRVLCDAIVARLARFRIKLSHYLGFRFLQKNDVGIGVAAQDAEILAIRRPVE
jgi:hypothetical protein